MAMLVYQRVYIMTYTLLKVQKSSSWISLFRWWRFWWNTPLFLSPNISRVPAGTGNEKPTGPVPASSKKPKVIWSLVSRDLNSGRHVCMCYMYTNYLHMYTNWYIYILCHVYYYICVCIYIYIDHFRTKRNIVTSPGFCLLRPFGRFWGTPEFSNDIVRTLGSPEMLGLACFVMEWPWMTTVKWVCFWVLRNHSPNRYRCLFTQRLKKNHGSSCSQV